MAKAPSKRRAPATTAKKSVRKAAPPAREMKVLQPEIVEDGEFEARDLNGRDDLLDPEILEPGEAGYLAGAAQAESDLADADDDEPVVFKEIDPDADLDEKEFVPPVRGKARTPEIVEKGLTTIDPVAQYLSEIRKYPLLTKEQEQDLARRYRENGDAKAAEALVTSNLRFVVKVAAEYSRFGAKLIDLVQEGNVGLMHAVKEFNPYKGVRLITYAVWWIRGYIQEYLMRQYSLVRIGTTQNQRKLFYRLQKEREALGRVGTEPTTALLAGRLGVTEAEVESMSQRLSGRDVSLNTPLDGENSAASLLDFEATGEVGVDDRIGHLEEMNVLRENIEKIRGTLNEKETYILTRRILSDEPMTLQEIGDLYGVTRESVRQIEARLIGRIRKAVRGDLHENDD